MKLIFLNLTCAIGTLNLLWLGRIQQLDLNAMSLYTVYYTKIITFYNLEIIFKGCCKNVVINFIK